MGVVSRCPVCDGVPVKEISWHGYRITCFSCYGGDPDAGPQVMGLGETETKAWESWEEAVLDYLDDHVTGEETEMKATHRSVLQCQCGGHEVRLRLSTPSTVLYACVSCYVPSVVSPESWRDLFTSITEELRPFPRTPNPVLDETTEPSHPQCVCGAEACGLPAHSRWCDLYEGT